MALQVDQLKWWKTMPIPSGSDVLYRTLANVTLVVGRIRTSGSGYISDMAAGPVDTGYVFRLLDQLRSAITILNEAKVVPGLNAYATAAMPNYAGTMTTDIQTTIDALQACIDWVVVNFPKDNTATWILAEQLMPDGTRSYRNFTTGQTAGMRTVLTALVATVS